MFMNIMLDSGAFMPERAHSTDAGADLRSREDKVVPAHGSATFDTGVHIALPPNRVGLLKSKSGLNVKHNLVSTGVIDEPYNGSIVVKLYNLGDADVHIEAGQKITQLLVMPVDYVTFKQVDHLEETDRGSAGFGSTGK